MRRSCTQSERSRADSTKERERPLRMPVLTSRVIDRPMRPLFPKDYRNDVTLDNVVMSVDPDCSPELTAMLGSAIATCISDIPFDGPCATTQVGLIDGEFVINPTADQKRVSDLGSDRGFHQREGDHDRGRRQRSSGSIRCLTLFLRLMRLTRRSSAFIDTIVAECGKRKAYLRELCCSGRALCSYPGAGSSGRRWKRLYLPTTSRPATENIDAITARLEEAFAENEEWLACTRRRRLPVSEEDGPQDDS